MGGVRTTQRCLTERLVQPAPECLPGVNTSGIPASDDLGTASRRVECQHQSRWLACTVTSLLALAALPVLVVIYNSSNFSLRGTLGADIYLQRHRRAWESGTAGSRRPQTMLRKDLPLGDAHGEGQCAVNQERSWAIEAAEPLIAVEPLKPWVAFKKNLQNIVHLSTVSTLSNYNRHIYIDMGARDYESSIGSWFMNHYPKQGKVFEIFAIEADKSFQSGYANHSDVHFLPYAAWIRNESLIFGINNNERGGMGRIHRSTAGSVAASNLQGFERQDHHFLVPGFDFAHWLRKMALPDDYVVLKMDVEGTEFQLLPHLFSTGAVCLIDELFLECHYNRWQRCCPERTSKFSSTYDDCLALFHSLRRNGVLVHQWW